MSALTTRPGDALVVFGITGDLARKMTLRSLYRLDARGLLDCPVIGVAVEDWTDEHLREHALEAVKATGEPIDDAVWKRFAARLSYVSGDFGDGATYEAVASALGDAAQSRLLPGDPAVAVRDGVAGLSEAKLVQGGRRVVVEKPFGHDLSSARALARDLHKYLEEPQLYRIDHFLGKMGSRRSSTCASPTRSSSRSGTATTSPRCRSRWPRASASRTAATSMTRWARCATSWSTTCCRSSPAAAMDPPAAGDPDSQKDAKQAVFAAMADAEPEHYVRGQYEGYRDIDGVRANSDTETYAALRLDIDSWRWSGVPFFIRTGKRLPVTQTELRLVFRHAPRLPFIPSAAAAVRSPARSSSGSTRTPASGSSSTPSAPTSRAPAEIDLDMEFAKEGGEGATPYEVLLHAALIGDASHFTRQDSVEECWRVLQPLLDSPPKVIPYAPGLVGARRGRRAHRRLRRLARPLAPVLALHRTTLKRVGRSCEAVRRIDGTRSMRLSLGSIIWLIVGVLLASSHHYLNHVNALKPVVSALLAIVLWPLLLLGINLHVH